MARTLEAAKSKPDGEKPICGVIRPISDMGAYTATHWREVHDILSEGVESAGYIARLVSETDNAGVILSEIVTNLYNDPVVIADVSGRNPNVMFELGMRLAFEKPTIIIMDTDTPFTFDISPVKHLRYPSTLRYSDINTFKDEISHAITATVAAAGAPGHRGYLQQFGPIKVTELGTHDVDVSTLARDVQDIKRLISSPTLYGTAHVNPPVLFPDELDIPGVMEEIAVDIPESLRDTALNRIMATNGVVAVSATQNGARVAIGAKSSRGLTEIRNQVRSIAADARQMMRVVNK